MFLKLVGEANDYVGKGMAGGEVVIVPPPGSPFEAEDASLVGNTCLYGATGGRLFVNGRAGILLCPSEDLFEFPSECRMLVRWLETLRTGHAYDVSGRVEGGRGGADLFGSILVLGSL